MAIAKPECWRRSQMHEMKSLLSHVAFACTVARISRGPAAALEAP
jgi:hypothetical protein